MTTEHTNVKNSVARFAFAALSLMLQVVWLAILFQRLNDYSVAINILTSLLAFLVALVIQGRRGNSEFKLAWVMVILLFPVFGLCLYALMSYKGVSRKIRRRCEKVTGEIRDVLSVPSTVLKKFEDEDLVFANQSRYIVNASGYPVYDDSAVEFYSDAAECFERQLAEIAGAKSFVFLEYYAIEEAQSFARLRALLAAKVTEGVQVRILYDDVGSTKFIDPEFIRRMEYLGIKCRVFNPFSPLFNIFMNNRDHRKLTVIDGLVGFTGGYNLADEYFHIVEPYGYWKDTAVMLRGAAVKSLTAMFLSNWNAMGVSDRDFSAFFPDQPALTGGGYIQPYADTPLDDEYLGENVYLNLIKSAQRRLWVSTPYLIISDEMERELTLAAQRGVDVRIITPGIPDKKIIYAVTRSYYARLVEKGVRIYEYTPGFNHAKQMLCDDRAATVGTINLDYRSLYHHFEDGVLIIDSPVVADIAADFVGMFAASAEVSEQYKGKQRLYRTVARYIMRLFAPLL